MSQPVIHYRVILLLACFWLVQTWAADEKPISDVAPSLAELGEGWTTNLIAYLLDPRSQPSEIDYLNRKPSPVLEYHRQEMAKDGRTAYGTIFYGHGDMVMGRGLYRVYIQRWGNTRSLHNRWVDWKMNPNWVVRTNEPVGEDCYWIEDQMFQSLTFRRGLFHVSVEAGLASEYRPMIRLAKVIDAKIRGRPIPKLRTAAKPDSQEKAIEQVNRR
jgi:hypothetical protein